MRWTGDEIGWRGSRNDIPVDVPDHQGDGLGRPLCGHATIGGLIETEQSRHRRHRSTIRALSMPSSFGNAFLR